MDTLISLGRGYSAIGAILSVLIAVIVLVIGNNIRNNDPDPDNKYKGKIMMVVGVIIGVIGVGLWYLAKTNDDVAAFEGAWLVALILMGIIGAFKTRDNVQMKMV